jgi:hypothetical protein
MVIAPAVAPLLQYEPGKTSCSGTRRPCRELELFFQGQMKRLCLNPNVANPHRQKSLGSRHSTPSAAVLTSARISAYGEVRFVLTEPVRNPIWRTLARSSSGWICNVRVNSFSFNHTNPLLRIRFKLPGLKSELQDVTGRMG